MDTDQLIRTLAEDNTHRARPVGFALPADGRVEVTVHQLVRSPAGEVLVDRTVRHVYALDGNVIRRMDIE